MANFQEKFHWTKMFSFDNGKVASFTWYNMTLRNTVQNTFLQFTFQVNLFPSGKIQLVYLDLPHVSVEHAIDMKHQITMGLSDAYLIGILPKISFIFVFMALHILKSISERKSGNLVHEQIVTYHSVNIFNEISKTTSVQEYPEITVTFSPLKTCNQFDSCWDCLTHGTDFNCIWCPGLNKCSDNGIDRNYQVYKINLKDFLYHFFVLLSYISGMG